MKKWRGLQEDVYIIPITEVVDEDSYISREQKLADWEKKNEETIKIHDNGDI